LVAVLVSKQKLICKAKGLGIVITLEIEEVIIGSEQGVGNKFRTSSVSRITVIISLIPYSPSSIAERAKEEAIVR
jgi:hypothetical protein